MATDHRVVLRIAATGEELSVWNEFRLTIDVMQPGSAWTFALWRSLTTGSTWREIRSKVKLGTKIQILIDGALQLEGQCEQARVVRGRKSGAVYTISGRDLSASAIDSDADPHTNIKGMGTSDAIASVLTAFDLRLVVGAEAEAAREVSARIRPGARGTSKHPRHRRKPVDLYRIKPGEKAMAVCQQLALKAGLFLWTGPVEDGTGVILDVPGTSGEALFRFDRREVGDDRFESNFYDSDYEFTIRGIPTALCYWANGSRISDKGRTRCTAYNATITEDSPVVEPLSIDFWHQKFITNKDAKNLKELKNFVEHTVASENVRHRVYTITCQGFSQDYNGKVRLFAVNSLCRFRDDDEEPKIDEFMVLMRVSFSQNRDGGQDTSLTLIPRTLCEFFPDDRAG